MRDRFQKAGIDAILHPGVPSSDPRIAGRGLIPHTEKCWSCMYGHLDMIREFLERGTHEYGIFCEDDILIDADFKLRLEHVLSDFKTMQMDTMLLGYLITYPIVGESNGSYSKIGQSIYVDMNTAETTTFRYYEYGDIWGTQMYMLSRNQASRIIEKYANGYADTFCAPFSADWTITKEGKRCIVYPMLAIEDGQTVYGDDECGQREFHMMSHSSHMHISNYI